MIFFIFFLFLSFPSSNFLRPPFFYSLFIPFYPIFISLHSAFFFLSSFSLFSSLSKYSFVITHTHFFFPPSFCPFLISCSLSVVFSSLSSTLLLCFHSPFKTLHRLLFYFKPLPSPRNPPWTQERPRQDSHPISIATTRPSSLTRIPPRKQESPHQNSHPISNYHRSVSFYARYSVETREAMLELSFHL